VSWTCEFQNHSTLSAALFSELSAAFQEELQRQETGTPPNKPTVPVLLSITQNLTEYLGIVRILKGDSSETLIASWAFVEGSSSTEPASVFSLRKELLFSQKSPILDVVFERDGKRASALGLREISNYELQNDRWTLGGIDLLPVETARRPEQRGFLSLSSDSRTAYFPGEVCQTSVREGQGWKCEKYAGQVPTRSAAPELLNSKEVGSWIAAAQLGADRNAMLVVTEGDTTARLYEDRADAVASFSGWGSEIASLASLCGSGWQLLVTGNGDWTETDEIHAVEIQNHRAHSVSPPVEFPGPVVLLLTPGSATDASPAVKSSAIGIVRNLQTGMYETYRLTMACGS